MQDLALGDQIFDGASDFFNRYVRVDAVLVVQVDSVGLQAIKRLLYNLFYVFWTAVQTNSAIDGEAKFTGYLYLVSERLEGFTNQFFVCVRAVDFGGVKKVTPFSKAVRRVLIPWSISAGGP